MPIKARLARCQEYLPTVLKRYLPPPTSPLTEAMHYACFNGGKRLRPLLVYTTGELFGASWEQLDPIAAAIELIHCYSLVHDDLPAMDNDDLRRGKPTCHKVYGEAMAILAGNALLTLAFELLVTIAETSPSSWPRILSTIAQAAGVQGMLQGQAIDLAAEKHPLSLEDLIKMHRAKTGALISASVQCGALGSGQATRDDLDELHNFGQSLGLSFQIRDDILDATGNSTLMGKHAGQDAKRNKCTFTTLLGVEQARQYAKQQYMIALNSLERFGTKADPLRALSHYVIERVA